MRTEALVYGFVAVAVACIVVLTRRQVGRAIVGGLLAAAGLLVPLAANLALEVATVDGTIRSGRAAGTASSAIAGVGGEAGATGTRVQEAMLNAAALTPALEPLSSLIGFGVLGLLAFVAWKTSRSADVGPAVLAATGVGALYAIRFAEGPGFVPGLVAATPLAAVGLVLGWRTVAGRYVVGVALLSLPLVWATQFPGGAAPQWAGRYILVSGLLLGVAGIAALPALRPWARNAVVGLAMVITAFGFVWMSIRTHDFGRALAALNRRPEPVLVSRIGHLAREGGLFYGDHRWLTAPTDADQLFAVHVLEEAGVTRFGLVETTLGLRDHRLAGWRRVGRDELELVDGLQLTVTTYEAA
ncbi:MAG: hypothetical protein ACR2MO_10975 [Acidimicrobiales bacterium]